MNELLDGYLSWQGQQTFFVIYLLVVLAITLTNAISLRHLGQYSDPARWPFVAVLIPARNEESTIATCVNSLLVQDYPHFAIWVLDDHSADCTPDILTDLSAGNPSLHVLQGQPLPAGWLGKAWACQQLADASDSELLLFVDSDTWHHPRMVRAAVAALEAERADLLSVIPDEVMVTLPEKLSVPLIPWSLFTHFLLVLAQWSNWPALATAIGQMMLLRRSTYQAVGGHGAVRAEVAEDMALARRVAAHGGRWRLLNGVEYVHCRMYHSFQEILPGFGKNLFAVFGQNLWLYLFIWCWLGVVYLSPWLILLWSALAPSPFSLPLAIADICLALTIWGITVWRLRLPISLIPLYPLSMTFSFLLAFYSLGQKLTGQATWKGRKVS